MATSATTPTTQDVRRALEQALGEGRLTGVADSKPLLRAGVITSIELVTILLDLEKAFGCKISPPDPASVTIALLTQLVGGEAAQGSAQGTAENPVVSGPGYRLFRSVARRPLMAIVLALLWLFVLDALVGLATHAVLSKQYSDFMEGGKRLYPRGSGEFSQDDFRFAVGQHEITTAPAQGNRRVVFFGDSGTIGSYLEPGQALPAQVEQRLNTNSSGWKVYNLAWFARLMSKDLMILDAVWDKPFEVAVFTVGDPFFSVRNSRLWIHDFRHTTVNLPLFREFTERMPVEDRPPFEEIGTLIAQSDRRQWGALSRFETAHFSLPHNQPFLFFLASGYYLRPLFGPMWQDIYRARNERIALTDPHQPLDLIPPADVDPALVKMLGSTIRLLHRRGVRTVLFVQPAGPAERQTEISPVNALTIANEMCRENDCTVVSERWGVPAPEFLDTLKHYTVEGNQRLARPVAEGILREGAR